MDVVLSAGEACNYEPRHEQLLKTLKLLTSAMSQGATDPDTMREIRRLGKRFLGQSQARPQALVHPCAPEAATQCTQPATL